MTTFILTRHGETVWHSENRYAGRSDVALTKRGADQGNGLARWAQSADLTGIWASTLSRAKYTAAKTADATGLPLNTDVRLCELDFGKGEGLTAAEMQEQFPQELAAFHRDPVAHHLPGGEHPETAILRITSALSDIQRAHQDGRILVVAHSTAIRLVLCSYLGIDPSRYRRTFPILNNCSLTEVRISNGNAALHSYNVPTAQAH
ncbi:phosphoserine phosphatase 1 [Arthrobacter tumbae]|uniref:histidine phosphatase family protein n=1 Tax=Arthrobacter tumbae TaxID=163874 RepID=UPI00195A9AF0|nr:histidine phosphatase family protein [Arthrobacter tumbae]MBM7780891.1 putative phosphoglycerate mutase [Arthrobacter tumbae]